MRPMLKFSVESTNPRRIFTLLVAYRWLSLLPALVLWGLASERPLLLPLFLAIASNILITTLAHGLNRALRQRPWLLLLDLALMALILALSGGWQSPFYLYTLNPLLIAAFFFGLRGALTAATCFLPLYLAALFIVMQQTNQPPNWLMVLTTIIGSYLIGGTFGYASGVVTHLHQAQTDLTQTYRNLEVIHQLTLSLQSASSVEEVQEKVLDALIRELGFSQALIGLVDEDGRNLVSWRGHTRQQTRITSQTELPLQPESGPVAQALLTRTPIAIQGQLLAEDTLLNIQFAGKNGRVYPMMLREHPVGVLIVTHPAHPTPNQLESLEAIAGQAAVTIGATMLCIDRARKLAVQEERLRIAQDIHDTVSQSLFGIVFTLDGSLKLLPHHPEEAIPELERALETADTVRQKIRHSILDLWPTQLTAERFTADLQKYAREMCQHNTEFIFDIRGSFATLSPKAQRSLYRISQEALNNVVQHAHAREARICVDVADGRAKLVVRDDGQGFDTAVALVQEFNREHFGLRGIQERAKALGGDCHIFSKPGAGTSIVVDIPI